MQIIAHRITEQVSKLIIGSVLQQHPKADSAGFSRVTLDELKSYSDEFDCDPSYLQILGRQLLMNGEIEQGINLLLRAVEYYEDQTFLVSYDYGGLTWEVKYNVLSALRTLYVFFYQNGAKQNLKYLKTIAEEKNVDRSFMFNLELLSTIVESDLESGRVQAQKKLDAYFDSHGYDFLVAGEFKSTCTFFGFAEEFLAISMGQSDGLIEGGANYDVRFSNASRLNYDSVRLVPVEITPEPEEPIPWHLPEIDFNGSLFRIRDSILLTGEWLVYADPGVVHTFHYCPVWGDQSAYLGSNVPMYPFSDDGTKCLLVEPCRQISEPAWVIGSSPNYFHWMTEYLPYYRAAKISMAIDGDNFPTKFVVHAPLSHYHLETLEMVGIHEDDLICCSYPEWVRLDEMVMPFCRDRSTFATSKNAVDQIRSIADDVVCSSTSENRRIYVARKNTDRRQLLQEEALFPILEQLSFDLIYPGDLSVKQQIQIFREAEIIVGFHGAGLTNCIFSNPGTHLIEFTPTERDLCYFRELAKTCGLKYKSISVPSASVPITTHPITQGATLTPQAIMEFEQIMSQL